jgi:hypothetical protein
MYLSFYLFMCVCQARKVIGHVFVFFIYLYVCVKPGKSSVMYLSFLFIYMCVPIQESHRSCICLFYLFICVCQARKVIGHVFVFFIYLYACTKHKKVIGHVFLCIIMGYQFCFFLLFWYLVLPLFRQSDICCFRFITAMKILYTNTILHAEIWSKRVIPIHVFMVTILSKLKVISISYVFVQKVVVIN